MPEEKETPAARVLPTPNKTDDYRPPSPGGLKLGQIWEDVVAEAKEAGQEPFAFWTSKNSPATKKRKTPLKATVR